jgi:hypothetical protein
VSRSAARRGGASAAARSRRDGKMVMYALTSGGAVLLVAVMPLREKVPV